jgi:hypothetical protein
MRRLKGDLRKSDIVIIGGMLLLTLLIVAFALLGTGQQTAPSGQTPGMGTVQGTPTVDATAVAGDILKQQDEQLQRANSGLWPYWLSVSGSIGGIGAILAAVAAFIVASRGFKQWLGNRQDEQVKRAEERFQKVVEGLGSERVEAKFGAAIMLRTFLQEEQGYEQFYRQAFDLAVAHLRLRKAEVSIPGPPNSPAPVLIVPEGSL